MWLQSKQLQENTILRLKREDIDWSRSVRNDLEKIKPTVKRMMSKRFQGKAQIFNVYISQWEPVDDWNSVLEDTRQSIPVDTVFFTEDKMDQQVQVLQTALRLREEEAIAIFALCEEEPEVLRHRLAQVIKLRKQQQEQLLSYANPIVTKILIAIQVIMFGVLEWYGGSTDTATLVQFGAKYNVLIVQGEWWRFITPIFLHIGILHLLMNTVALYYVGNQVERILGNVRFFIVYMFAGFSGSVLSFVLSDNISAGASGAIFGCFGALLYISLLYSKLFSKETIQGVLTLIGINLLFGIIVPGIDNAGHIGGLIGGFLATVTVHTPKQKVFLLRRAGSACIAVSLIICLVWYGFLHV